MESIWWESERTSNYLSKQRPDVELKQGHLSSNNKEVSIVEKFLRAFELSETLVREETDDSER